MCSRGVFQLKKLSIYFCDFGGSSFGVRQLITSSKIKDFITANPQIQLEVICKRNHHPLARGKYVNGYLKEMPLRSLTQDQSLASLYRLRNQLGRKSFQVNGSRVYGAIKTIQGQWQPNLFNKYPICQMSKVHPIPDIPMQKHEKQHPYRNVRPRDFVNEEMKVREFIDPYQMKC